MGQVRVNIPKAFVVFAHEKEFGTSGDVSSSGDGIGKCASDIAATGFKKPDGTHVVVMFNTNSCSAAVKSAPKRPAQLLRT